MNEHTGSEEAQQMMAEAPRSGWWRLQGIFLEPGETFRQIALKPNFVLPLVALILMGMVTSGIVINLIGYENIMRQQISQSPQLQEMSAGEREELIQTQINNPVIKVLSYIGPIFAGILVVIVAGLLMLGVRLLGSESSFSQIFSVTCHSYFAQAVVGGILLCLVVFVSGDRASIDVNNAVQSNLGMLVDQKESPVLFSLASSIDLVSFYLIFLLSLGLSTLGRKPSFAGALGVVLFWWLVWIALKAGFTALLS